MTIRYHGPVCHFFGLTHVAAVEHDGRYQIMIWEPGGSPEIGWNNLPSAEAANAITLNYCQQLPQSVAYYIKEGGAVCQQ